MRGEGSPQGDSPKVVVGIPVWGHSPYLAETIRCIEDQTLSDWRLHISQDGPEEASVAELVAQCTDERIIYTASGQAAGAARNKTRLVQSAETRYVALLDHDDLWDPNFLRRRVAFLDANPRCGFVFSPNRIIDAEGRTIGRSRSLLATGVHPTERIVPQLLQWSGIPGSTVVARRSAYREVGDAFSDELPRTYDYEMWVRLALRHDVGYLDVCEASWRRHGRNTSLTDLRGYEDEYELLVTRLSALVATAHPGLSPPADVWARKVSSLLLTSALDAIEAHERRIAWRFLVRALQRRTRSALDPRVLALLVGIVFGTRGTSFIAGVRRVKHRALARARAPRSA
jgi:glycosyltransferase involved in cell wall biosynthesis